MTDPDYVEIVPMGGWGEFGMNMMAVRYGDDLVVVDSGLMFPREDLLGVDFVVPELTFLKEHAGLVRAVILTHGHEDHIGALPYLLEEIQVPVYGTALTLGLARNRLQEHGILGNAELRTVRPRDSLEIGRMKVTPFGLTHSIPDALGLWIETPVGGFVHTGDFKFDPSPPDRKLSDYAFLSEIGNRGPLALLSDSTNSEQPGHTPSEAEVGLNLKQIISSSSQKVIIACFASSIHRIQIVLDLAAQSDRRVVPLGRSMVQNIAIARQLGYLSVPDGVMADNQEGAHLAPEHVILLSSGSQGEPMAALARLALEKFKHFTVEDGDTVVISARTIPGNQTRVSHLINHFCRRGARVYHDGSAMVHASGHGSQEEQRLMINLTRPKFFLPLHGEYRQLYQHALIARECGIPAERILVAETGDILWLSPDGVEVCGRAPVGRRLIDEGGVTELDEFVVKDRQHLSEEGIVLAVLAINKSTGMIEGVPELVSRGHSQETNQAELMAEARRVVLETLEDCSSEERSDSLLLTERVRTDLKRFFRKRTATRPMIVPVILEI